MNDTVQNDPYAGREELRPYPVTLTITPTGVPAAELPFAMVSDIADVCAVHGLRVADAAKTDPTIWSVLLLAIGRVLDVVAVEFGGRGGGEQS